MTQAIEQRGDRIELIAIEGEQLSAVTFVQDYVQLHFDGPTITAITRPMIVLDNVNLDFGSPGYRDRLCELIGRKVASAYVKPNERLQLDFDEQASLVVSLKAEAYRGAEAVILTDAKNEGWAVW